MNHDELADMKWAIDYIDSPEFRYLIDTFENDEIASLDDFTRWIANKKKEYERP